MYNTGKGARMKVKNELFLDASGSMDGLTFCKNTGVLSVKLKKSPPKSRTPRQAKIRNNFARSRILWAEISEDARADWRQWARTLERRDRLGNKVTFSAISAFTGAYLVATERGTDTTVMGQNVKRKAGFVSKSDIRFYIENNKIKMQGTTDWKHEMIVYKSEEVSDSIYSTNRKYSYSQHGLINTMQHPMEEPLPPAGRRFFLRFVIMAVDLRYSETFYKQVDGS